VTDDSAGRSADALGLVREITRGAGHEIRNALNGVAVNVEVVRSRLARDLEKKDLLAFAERASFQVGVANTLTEGLLSFVGCVLSAQADGTLRAISGSAGNQLELMIYGDRTDSLVSAIKRFGELTGVGVEERDGRVILSLSSEGRSHSKE
jgi:hypothetical protein